MKPDQWPEPDRLAWAKALEPAGPFDEQGRALKWEASTRNLYVNGYGRWLTWLDTQQELDRTAPPEARATLDRVRAYYRSLADEGLGGFTIAQRLMALSAILGALAPTGDFAWIKDASIRVHRRARPVKDVERRLQAPAEVLKLGYDLIDEAEDGALRTELQRALLYRDGLAIVLLVHRPVRIGNFAAIRIGKHLERRGEEWWLTFDADEVKNDRRFDCPLPADLAGKIERYLECWRPVLVSRRNGKASQDRLWLTQFGTPLKSNDMNPMICRRTRERFGTPINPHAFRSLAATTIATHNPEGVTGIAAVLGHSRLETSEVHYNKARQADAACQYQIAIGKRGGRNVRRRRGRSNVDFGPLFASLTEASGVQNDGNCETS